MTIQYLQITLCSFAMGHIKRTNDIIHIILIYFDKTVKKKKQNEYNAMKPWTEMGMHVQDCA